MGTTNRQRREAKRKHADRRRAGRSTGGSAGGWSDGGWSDGDAGPGEDLRWLLMTASRSRGREADQEAAIAATAVRIGAAATSLAVADVLGELLDGVWEGGWQPGELVRAVRREHSGEHADLVTTAIAAWHADPPGPLPPAWAAQLERLGATELWWSPGRGWLAPWAQRRGADWVDALQVAAGVIGLLMRLPVVEPLMARPSEWSSGIATSGAIVDEAVLAKVRALLAKAESTGFEHEADALTAKAQELMARHAIDAALASGAAGAPREAPSGRRVAVDDPYAGAKAILLSVVAGANNVRAVWSDLFATMTLVGFEADLDAVEVLFTSLLMQASRAMLAKGKVRDERGRTRTRSFRQSFLVAFGDRIRERLFAAAQSARADAERELGRDLLPVLAGRREEVDDLMDRWFPQTTVKRRSGVTNREGWMAGRVAAEMATLGPHTASLEGGRPA